MLQKRFVLDRGHGLLVKQQELSCRIYSMESNAFNLQLLPKADPSGLLPNEEPSAFSILQDNLSRDSLWVKD